MGWSAVSDHASEVARTVIAACPQARIFPVPILDAAGQSSRLDTLDRAFGWLAENAVGYGIELICAPISDGTNRIDDSDVLDRPFAQAIADLRKRGVFTLAAAGNGFRAGSRRLCQGMGAPAIIRESISIGALDGTSRDIASGWPWMGRVARRVLRIPQRRGERAARCGFCDWPDSRKHARWAQRRTGSFGAAEQGWHSKRRARDDLARRRLRGCSDHLFQGAKFKQFEDQGSGFRDAGHTKEDGFGKDCRQR